MVCRYEQDCDDVPVLGDDLVVTYNGGQVKNAYGTAQKVNEDNGECPCDGIKNTNDATDKAIKLAKNADANKNGKGTF